MPFYMCKSKSFEELRFEDYIRAGVAFSKDYVAVSDDPKDSEDGGKMEAEAAPAGPIIEHTLRVENVHPSVSVEELTKLLSYIQICNK